MEDLVDIFFDSAINLTGRLAVSLSVQLAQSVSPSPYQLYKERAWVPKLPWLPAERHFVFQPIIGGARFRPHASIAILRMDDDLVGEVMSVTRERPLTGKSDADALLETVPYKALIKRLRAHSATASAFQFLGLSSKPPGKYTSTYDGQVSRYIGLHLDAWDPKCLKEPQARAFESARNRISINIGPADRYFLFVATPVGWLLKTRDYGRYPLAHCNEIVDQHFSQWPDARVFRLTLQPGEAYIAPTENVIHDATTLGKTDIDLRVTALGQFGPTSFIPSSRLGRARLATEVKPPVFST